MRLICHLCYIFHVSTVNRLFPPHMLDILLHPERWTLVAGHGVTEHAPINHKQHTAWMQKASHAHAHHEICLVVAGQGVHGFNGAVYPCTPGTVFYFAAHDSHDQAPPPHLEDMDQLWFSVLKDFVMARVLAVRRGEYTVIGKGSRMLSRGDLGLSDCRSLFARAGTDKLPVEVRRAHLRAAVALLVTALVETGYGEQEPQESGSFQGQVIAAICRHIEETAGHGESLESLARLSGYSRYHFLRLFKKHAGRTVHEHIDRCRLQRVHAMRAAGHPRREIAAALGFSSPAVFARWYRKCSNTPPGSGTD